MGGHFLADKASEARLLLRQLYLEDYRAMGYPTIKLCEERAAISHADISNALNHHVPA